MKHLRKLAALFLSICLLLSCALALASEIQVAPGGELPIVPEGTDVTLKVAVVGFPYVADYETNYFTTWLEERTGVKLDFIVYPNDSTIEKVLLELNSGDVSSLPDVYLAITMGTNTIFGASYAPNWYDQGMIIPLNEMIEKYGTNLKAALDIAKGYGYDILPWMTSSDGNIYSLPAFSASLTNSYPNKMWINQGWLTKLGLEMPTTTEEFREVLRAFKTKDPNGNGLADEIPLAGAKAATGTVGIGTIGYDFIINAFIYNDSLNSRLYVEEGVVKFAPITSQWREAMKYLRELCDEGLFYAGSFTQDGTALLQIGSNENDILGAFEGLGFEAAITAKDLPKLEALGSVPALIGPEGKHYVTWAAPSIRPAGIITANCKYPEVAFRVLDEMMSYEGSLITRYGEQGINWDYADEGTTSYYSKQPVLKVLENTWAVPGQNQNFMQQSPFILDPAIATGIQWDGQNLLDAGYIKALSVMKLDETGEIPAEFIANLVYTPEEIDILTTPKNDIDTYVLRSIANFVAGDWDPKDDKQWEAYIAEFEKMGLSTLVDTVQTVYTRMYSK